MVFYHGVAFLLCIHLLIPSSILVTSLCNLVMSMCSRLPISSSSPVLLLHVTNTTSQSSHFTQEPQDTVVYKNNLVLNCTAQSDPSPTITWYRGDPPALVPDVHVVNGSLVIPTVVEGVDASRGGIPYHCRATTAQFGTIRSRTANVYYACELATHNNSGIQSMSFCWQSLVDFQRVETSYTV